MLIRNPEKETPSQDMLIRHPEKKNPLQDMLIRNPHISGHVYLLICKSLLKCSALKAHEVHASDCGYVFAAAAVPTSVLSIRA
jgi:hypothetical protein